MKAIISMVIGVLAVFATQLQAGTPMCVARDSGPFCYYAGKVSKIYVNASNMILLYFDTPLDMASANSVGFTPSNPDAAIVNLLNTPEFAKLFYSTALSAQATGRAVSIQMRGTDRGYLIADRIWLPE